MSDLFVWLKDNPLFSGGMGLAPVAGALAYFREVPRMVWHFLSSRLIATLTITSDDDAFLWMQHWFADRTSATRSYSVVDSTDKYSSALRFGAGADKPEVETTRLRLGPGTHFIKYLGRRMLVTMTREKTQSRNRSYSETLTLRTWLGTKSELEAMVASAKVQYEHLVEQMVKIWTLFDGEWILLGYRPLRPHDSVILADDQLDRLLTDAREFKNERAWYIERGIPHRRGYLLTGPPGNGKSSVAHMLASELGLGVHILNLAERGLTDRSLQRAMGDIDGDSLILLEDVDAAFAEREAETSVTFSGVLNALDGMVASEGRVVVLTTNHPERLDPALIRPGRVDMIVNLPNATSAQAAQLYERVLGQPGAAFGARIPEGQYSMAQLQEHLIRFRNDPTAAVTAPVVQ